MQKAVYSKLHRTVPLGEERGAGDGSGMGKETSYKMRNRVSPPDSFVGRKAVEIGLITEEQLQATLELMSEPTIPGQVPPSTVSAALVASHLLTRQQVEALQEAAPGPDGMGRYKLGRKLGRGGMGVVYEAEDGELRRRVALKMLRFTSDADPSEIAEDEERFVREARLTARLPKHPNIVSVFEAGILGGRRYIAMELIEGVQFQEWRAQKTTTLRQKISVLRDVALAVDHAHRHGVIHRDLKPANILVDAQHVPHVTDFGLAKQITRELGGTLTESGYLLGTPSYVSPEQAQGAKNVDRRTDVWSLGIMLYEVLTDRLPFQGMNALDIVLKTIRDPIAPPSATTRRTTLASTDRALETICMRALCKSPEERYQSALAMAEDMTRWLQGRRVMAKRPRQKVARWKFAAAAAAVVLALLGAVSLKEALSTPAPTAEERAADLVMQGRKHMLQNRPTEALIAFGRALEEDPKSRIAASGKKEAQEKMIALAKPPVQAAPKAAPPASDPNPGLLETASFEAHKNGVHIIAFSPDGKRMLTGSYDNALRLWDMPGRTLKKELSATVMPVSATISRDGRRIAGGFFDHTLRLWDSEGAPQRPLEGHGLQVTGVAFMPDSALLASTSTDGSARLWDSAAATSKSSMRGFPKGAMCLAMTRDGRKVAVGSADRMIRIVDTATWTTDEALEGIHESEVLCVAFSPDGRRLVSSGMDGNVVLMEPGSGKQQVLSGHTKKVNSVSFSPDGQWIVSVSYDRSIRLWNGRTGSLLRVIPSSTPCFVVAFSPDGQTMAVGTGNGEVRLWTLQASTAAK
jgi:eukaryotic-like serine/threonine-protein kinase